LPPGLAFVAVSDKAWKVIESHAPRSFYFDLKKAKKSVETNDTPFTPAHTLIRAMKGVAEEDPRRGDPRTSGSGRRVTRRRFRGAFTAAGTGDFPERPNTALTVVKCPVDSSQLLSKLEKQYGLKLANGQDDLKGKIFRVNPHGVHRPVRSFGGG